MFLIDVGGEMGAAHHGRPDSDLNQVKEYVLDIIGDKVRLLLVLFTSSSGKIPPTTGFWKMPPDPPREASLRIYLFNEASQSHRAVLYKS